MHQKGHLHEPRSEAGRGYRLTVRLPSAFYQERHVPVSYHERYQAAEVRCRYVVQRLLSEPRPHPDRQWTVGGRLLPSLLYTGAADSPAVAAAENVLTLASFQRSPVGHLCECPLALPSSPSVRPDILKPRPGGTE